MVIKLVWVLLCTGFDQKYDVLFLWHISSQGPINDRKIECSNGHCFGPIENSFEGCLSIVAKDIKLGAVGSQFQPYPYSRMCLHADGALVVWPGMLFQNSWGYSSCHSQEQLLLTWKRPLFALTRPTAQAVPECSPKSSSIEFAIKNFVCLLEEPSGRIDRWQAGAQTWTQTWTLQPDKGYICSEIPE